MSKVKNIKYNTINNTIELIKLIVFSTVVWLELSLLMPLIGKSAGAPPELYAVFVFHGVLLAIIGMAIRFILNNISGGLEFVKRYATMSVEDYELILGFIALAYILKTKSIPGKETFIDSDIFYAAGAQSVIGYKSKINDGRVKLNNNDKLKIYRYAHNTCMLALNWKEEICKSIFRSLEPPECIRRKIDCLEQIIQLGNAF